MSLLSHPLQAFLAIVRAGTVHGAAREIGLTQTAITQRIRALERDLQTSLFLRSRKGMQLTGEGEALLRYCRGAEDLEGEALSTISGSGRAKAVTVSVIGPTSTMSSRVVEQSVPLYPKWPCLQLNLVIMDTDDRLPAVRSGKATLAIVPPEAVPNEMDSKMLRPDKYILVASKAWRGRRLPEILANERLIDFHEGDPTSIDYLKKHGLSEKVKQPRLFVNNNEAIIKLFCHGVGFGTLTQEVARPHLASGDLIPLNGGAFVESPLALAWYPRPEMPGYLKAVIDAIQ